jgi:hypothetical protein
MSDKDIILQGVQNHQNDLGYQLQILNNYQQLHDAVEKENNTIYSTYYHDLTFNSANSRQSKYVYQSTTILNTVNTWGFWIYIALAIVLSVLIIRSEMGIYSKIGYVIAALGYPFYIYPLEEIIYKLSVYIWNLLISVTYDNGYKNTSLEYGIASGEKLSGPPVSEKAASLLHEASYVTGEKGENGEDIPPLYVPPTRPPAPQRTEATLTFDTSNDSSSTEPIIDVNDWGTTPTSSPSPNI